MYKKISFLLLVVFALFISALNAHAQSDPYRVVVMVNGNPVESDPIYSPIGKPMSEGELYDKVTPVSIEQDKIDVTGVITSDYESAAKVMCDYIIETHFGYKVYQLSEHTKAISPAVISDSAAEGSHEITCSFENIGQALADSNTYTSGGEYLIHIWFMPLNKKISNIPLLIKDNAAIVGG